MPCDDCNDVLCRMLWVSLLLHPHMNTPAVHALMAEKASSFSCAWPDHCTAYASSAAQALGVAPPPVRLGAGDVHAPQRRLRPLLLPLHSESRYIPAPHPHLFIHPSLLPSMGVLRLSVPPLPLPVQSHSPAPLPPSQERISETLRLSPAVAGVTLLSFGNGAPDIFTQMSMAAGVSALVGALPERACLSGAGL